MVQAHDTGPNGVTVDELIARLEPAITDLLLRLDGEEFTTSELIDVMIQFPPTAAAYNQALRAWGEAERASKMVIHGQVIPGVLRRSSLVEWIGFAHGVDDEFAVPGLWRLRSAEVDG